MPSQEIQGPDVYSILARWTEISTGKAPVPGSSMESYLLEQSRQTAQELNQKTTLQLDLSQHGLDVHRLLQRRAVQAWKDIHQEQLGFEEVPDRCPQCGELLLGKWLCQLCGLELFRWQPTDDVRQSLDSMGSLPWNYVLLPDPRRRRLVFLYLDRVPEVAWQVNLPKEVCVVPVSARLLSDSEILVADRTGKVFICDLFGAVKWECALPLKEPVFANASLDGELIMIADRGSHQVLVLNRHQQLIWAYGHANQSGSEEGYLKNPSCIQLTSDGTFLIADTGNKRVLEVSEISRKIRRFLGDDLKLQDPTWCERLDNGYTMILDAASYRLLELNETHHLSGTYTYYQEKLDARYRVQNPIALQRRENGHYILASEERVVEVSLGQKRLLWYSLLTDLRPPSSFQEIEKQSSQNPPPKRMPLSATQLQTPFRLGDALRQVSVFDGAPVAFFEKLKLCLRYEEHPAGKLLIREAQRGDTMYLIREGQVEILKDFQNVAVLGPGEIFGEMALLNAESRTATVRTRTTCRLYRLNRLAFESVVQAFPEIHNKIKILAEARRQFQQPMAEGSARDRLEVLMETHRKRFAEMRKEMNQPGDHRLVHGPVHWKLRYTPLEQHLIQEAQTQNYHCLELHVRLHEHCPMKSVRVSLLVMTLEKFGEIIKTHPPPEAILKERLDHQVILTILTRATRAQILEEATSLAEIDEVQSVPVQF